MNKKYDDVDKKAILLKTVVKVVADGGLENASVRIIADAAGFPGVFIYRYFEDKDFLISSAYKLENEKLMKLLIKAIEEENQYIDTHPLKQRSAYVISTAWKYLTENVDVCKFLVYYYNSPSFAKFSMEEHSAWVDKLCEALYPTFGSKEDEKAMLYMVFNSVYAFAMQVANGQIPNTKETEEVVFRNIYTAILACYEKLHSSGI